MTAPNPKREGYTFVGWDKEVVETMPDNDETYTAVWMKNTYTIRFNTEGGNEIKEMVVYNKLYVMFIRHGLHSLS